MVERNHRGGWRLPAVVWVACAVLGVAQPALAGAILYGDFGPDFPSGITRYLNVTESSGTDAVPPGRFGPPSITGDTLDFNPTSFVASATGGGSDITDVQLNFDLMVLEVNNVVAGGLTSLFITESGDFTLFGAGTATTAVAAGVSARINVLEVDGNPITPIDVFASNSIVRDLVSDGPVVLAPWSNGLLVDFGPVLAANNISFDFGVTKAEIALDDQLIAVSEPSSTAFIAKKDFVLQPGIGVLNPAFVNVPEPFSAVLVVTAVAWMARLRRRTA